MKPLGAVRQIDPIGDDLVDDGVGDELARIHDRLGALADVRFRRDGRTQHVAGGKLGDRRPV